MFLSIIIPTIGREKLHRAAASALGQAAAGFDFEVIVVNDSGAPLPPAAWQDDPRLTLTATPQVERSAARNAGARLARGAYLLFLDDDDYLLPGACGHFFAAAQTSRAGFIYGRARLVDRQGNFLVELQHEQIDLVREDWQPLASFRGAMTGNCMAQLMAGEFIPIMACIYRAADFAKTGGFHEAISCAEDVDLARHMALYADAASLPEVVVCAELGSEGSTTDKSSGTAQSHLARERILDKPETFGRLGHSARKGAYWHGRVLRTYASSALWNLRRGDWGRAARRGGQVAASLCRAGGRAFTRLYWLAVRRQYINAEYMRGYLRAGWK
jgi:GT2 family glycosyltransferase